MALSDADIERYSRQIILPEIGGRGQERLLGSAVAIAGTTELAAIAARYLAGAGIGTLCLDAAALAAFGEDLRRLNPAVRVRAAAVDAATTAIVAADLGRPALETVVRQARARGVPLVAAARVAGGGWLHVARGDACDACAACAAAAVRPTGETTALDVVATGVLGSLLALAALECALGLENSAAALRWFAADTSLLTPLDYTRRPDCVACR